MPTAANLATNKLSKMMVAVLTDSCSQVCDNFLLSNFKLDRGLGLFVLALA